MESLLEHIPYGKENAVSRASLGELRGGGPTGDRRARKEIKQLREAGEIIINDQSGDGYYRPTNMEEARRYLAQEESRARSIYRSLRALRRKVKALPGQERMKGV